MLFRAALALITAAVIAGLAIAGAIFMAGVAMALHAASLSP
jgi:hypothetical protein